MNVRYPVIPEFITVHIGAPSSSGRNITVPFDEYIKNVASGEIYSTWPVDAIKANVLAEITFALNRVYNEWYRSQGYEFDITSSSAYDQSFVENRQFFSTIVSVVDEIFNNYIRRIGQISPLYASYCDGKNTKCDGLSQWGSLDLALKKYSPLQILKYYYGNDIEIVYNAPVSGDIVSFPNRVLKMGDYNNYVSIIKTEVNRISNNYPLIPKLDNTSPLFDNELKNSIEVFQKTFDLKVTGEVDKSTWYKLKYFYNAVKKVSSLYSEGIKLDEVTLPLPGDLKLNDDNKYVRVLNYYLNVISYFDNNIPFYNIKGTKFIAETKELVSDIQMINGLKVNGIVNNETWNVIVNMYNNIIKNIPDKYKDDVDEIYPGEVLSLGSRGNNVLILQRYLYKICNKRHEIPGVIVNGVFDDLTESSIKYLQKVIGLEVNGIVGPITWYRIVEYSKRT